MNGPGGAFRLLGMFLGIAGPLTPTSGGPSIARQLELGIFQRLVRIALGIKRREPLAYIIDAPPRGKPQSLLSKQLHWAQWRRGALSNQLHLSVRMEWVGRVDASSTQASQSVPVLQLVTGGDQAGSADVLRSR
jgi:hypothetical protein